MGLQLWLKTLEVGRVRESPVQTPGSHEKVRAEKEKRKSQRSSKRKSQKGGKRIGKEGRHWEGEGGRPRRLLFL